MAVLEEERAMLRFLIVAVALTLATSLQAMPRTPVQQPNDIVIKVREACGAGMHRVGGVCVRTPARRGASGCARGVTC
jgi:hypothetical protein